MCADEIYVQLKERKHFYANKVVNNSIMFIVITSYTITVTLTFPPAHKQTHRQQTVGYTSYCKYESIS